MGAGQLGGGLRADGSGLTIKGTVYLYVPEGVTVTCTGANANGTTGGDGGRGGGGGAGGAQDKRANSKDGVYDVTAYGGKGGKNGYL